MDDSAITCDEITHAEAKSNDEAKLEMKKQEHFQQILMRKI